ncbi:MAG: 16S rRNA (guanine(966)-N(2))-methyltransferase RsmD [Acidimicrobiia bacterium]
MRVIAGTARGRPLKSPRGDRTRPTSDRVRQAVFNALGSAVPLVDAVVADLFAGTGALGIEALSRGAAHAVFVDDDAAARRLIAENLRTCGFADRAEVRGGDAVAVAATLGPLDIAFCDPPYRFERWAELLTVLDAGLVVVESDREVALPDRWELVRSKRYGSTVVLFAAPAASRAPHG